jgi:hypothetical protein
MKALLQITHFRFQRDFRKGLLFAAAQAGDLALHVQCGAERVLTAVTRQGVEAVPWRSFAELETALRACLGTASVIILTGVCGTYAPEVEAVLRLFPRRRRFYDVQDDLSYGASGLEYLKFLKRDFRWRWLCGQAVVLEQGMKRYYPGARHLDNASHIPSGRRASPPVRVVYIGSIDHRLDLALLEALSEHTDINILGSYHETAGALRPQLEALVGRCGRLHLVGPYDNDQLDELLAPYSIGLVPYKTAHPLTNHVNPDKIYHYLNAGLGVVSTAIPQALRMQKSLAILRGADAFAEAAEQALRARDHWRAEDYLWSVRWAEFREFVD